MKDPPAEALILPPAELQRIESASHVPAKEQEEAQRKAHQRKQEEKVGNLADARSHPAGPHLRLLL